MGVKFCRFQRKPALFSQDEYLIGVRQVLPPYFCIRTLCGEGDSCSRTGKNEHKK
jgi:hypothetical protein